MKSKNAGLYIHIPFCRSKCPYCDFYSLRLDESAANVYTRSSAAFPLLRQNIT